ncbi:MAG: hypothetical protein JSV83_07250 [Desulfobacterales bacterium]|nr:MAG: hypothetical protein JSV83_07250 [Desulfobacterales bacterium]
MPLMFTFSQMSYWPAKHLGDAGLESMKVRGRIQIGMVADITIFDAENVKDNSTYKKGEQGLPTSGIPYVIVNGRMAVKDYMFQKGVWAGQPIRYPVEDKGPFMPATKEQWLNTFTAVSAAVTPSASDYVWTLKSPINYANFRLISHKQIIDKSGCQCYLIFCIYRNLSIIIIIKRFTEILNVFDKEDVRSVKINL